MTIDKKQVLILEDEFNLRFAISEWLIDHRPDVNCQFASNGHELIDLIGASPKLPGLVILDVLTPPLDGIATLKWIRKNLPTLHVSVMSGSSLDRQECEQAGCTNFYVKPCAILDMGIFIDRIINFDYPIDPYKSNPFY